MSSPYQKEVALMMKNVMNIIGGKYSRNPIELLKFSTLDSFDMKSRDYIGISQIGGDCLRKIYYGVKNIPQSNPPDPDNVLKILSGHFMHKIIQGMVKEVYKDNAEIEITAISNENLKGHVDIILKSEIGKIIIDLKVTGNDNFLNYLGGFSKDLYTTQLGLYKDALDAKAAFIVYVNRDDFDYFIKEIDCSEEKIAEALLKADRLKKHMEKNDIPERPYLNQIEGEKKECKWCSYKDFCWKDYRKKPADHGKVIFCSPDEIKEFESLSEEILKAKEEEKKIRIGLKEVTSKIESLKIKRNSFITNTEADAVVLGDRMLKRIVVNKAPDLDKEKALRYFKDNGMISEFIIPKSHERISESKTPKTLLKES